MRNRLTMPQCNRGRSSQLNKTSRHESSSDSFTTNSTSFLRILPLVRLSFCASFSARAMHGLACFRQVQILHLCKVDPLDRAHPAAVSRNIVLRSPQGCLACPPSRSQLNHVASLLRYSTPPIPLNILLHYSSMDHASLSTIHRKVCFCRQWCMH